MKLLQLQKQMERRVDLSKKALRYVGKLIQGQEGVAAETKGNKEFDKLMMAG